MRLGQLRRGTNENDDDNDDHIDNDDDNDNDDRLLQLAAGDL